MRERVLEMLNGGEWQCAACGEPHTGMFDLSCIAPDMWPGDKTYRDNSELTLDGDFLSEDFCVMGGQHFFVRCVLEIPVEGVEQRFGFGCWGTLSRENFERYIDGFDNGAYQGEGPWDSWLCNRLLPFMDGETKPLLCSMFPQLDRQRPVLRLRDAGHALAMAQEQGIAPEDVLDIYAIYGHPPAG